MCYDCIQAKKNGLKVFECRLQVALDGIHQIMERPGSQLLTSNGMKQRADYRRSIANQIKRDGGEVNEEYDYEG